MSTKSLNYFICYAHANATIVTELAQNLERHFKASSTFTYTQWRDTLIPLGDDWHKIIQEALRSCDFGILMLSLDFFVSDYVTKHELPFFLNGPAHPIPVALEKGLFSGDYQTRGLEKRQAFYLNNGDGTTRSFQECIGPKKKDFSAELFRQIENVLKTR